MRAPALYCRYCPLLTLQLVAGAELGSADLLSTAGSGNLSLGNEATVATGNGDIRLAAGGDIVLGNDAAVLVMGRHHSVAENGGLYDFDGTIDIPASIAAVPYFQQFLRGASFPDVGGHVSLRAGGDIRGRASSQFVRDWHVRMGDPLRRDNEPPVGRVPRAWGLSIGKANTIAIGGSFRQGLGAWGGGNIDVAAAGDIENLQVNIATAGRQTGENDWPGSTSPWVTNSDSVDEIGGGLARVTAAAAFAASMCSSRAARRASRAGGDIASLAGTESMQVNHLALAMPASRCRPAVWSISVRY